MLYSPSYILSVHKIILSILHKIENSHKYQELYNEIGCKNRNEKWRIIYLTFIMYVQRCVNTVFL